MKIKFTDALCLGALFFMGVVSVHADPTAPNPAPNAANPIAPNPAAPDPAPNAADAELHRLMGTLLRNGEKRDKKDGDKKPRLIENITLNYEGSTPYSTEVLEAKVTAKLTQVSFLSALDAVLNASTKTCRIECRRVNPVCVSLNVKEAPVAGLLDALAKLGSARLYVLPSKLIIAPESALTEDEKKKAKVYGVLLTSSTLPNSADAKALTTLGEHNRSILDFANMPIVATVEERPIGSLVMYGRLKAAARLSLPYMGEFDVAGVGLSISMTDLVAPISMDLQGVKYGDALASLAHLLGCELYMTPKYFVISPASSFPLGTTPQYQGQPMFPAFVPSSISFPDLSAGKS